MILIFKALVKLEDKDLFVNLIKLKVKNHVKQIIYVYIYIYIYTW